MSELYPNDADLLALADDGPTGVEYIATGKAPYYLEFRRMLHRLLLHVAPIGLRVCKTGELAIRVKPGRYWLGGQLNEFAGSDEDLALADDAVNYIYVDADNTIGVSSAGWPAGEHVKLATVVAAGGDFDIDDIVDFRGGSMLSSLGSTLEVAPGQINQALLGIGATVTAENLEALTDGSNADDLHIHQSPDSPELFGNGSDGSIAYDPVDGRWEDGDGNPLSTVAGKWTVSGSTLSLLRPFNFENVDVGSGAELVIGVDGQWNWPRIAARGVVFVAGTLRAAVGRYVNHAATAKTSAGHGNTNQQAVTSSSFVLTGPRTGRGGQPGRGGGDGTNNGGTVYYDDTSVRSDAGMGSLLLGNALGSAAGTSGAGVNGANGTALTNIGVDPRTALRLPGGPGYGGSSGALKQAGGSNLGGAGGEGGAGGGIVDIVAYGVAVDTGGVIHADGAAGLPGQDGVASNAAGDISGGGGGGSGGGGGMVLIQYGPGDYSNSGTVRAAGGAGGAGGLGREYNGVARPVSNGGTGGNGSAGIVATVQIV